jgi:hypothetical protein
MQSKSTKTKKKPIFNADNWQLVLLIILSSVLVLLSIGSDNLPKSVHDKLPNITNTLIGAILSLMSYELLKDRDERILLRQAIDKLSTKNPVIEIREYEAQASNVVKNARKSVHLVLRTGKILEDIQSDFEYALTKNCKVQMIICQDSLENIKMIELDSDHSKKAIEVLFEEGDASYNILCKKYNKNSNNCNNDDRDILIQRKILDVPPTHLIYLSDPDEDYGQAFIIPIFFKTKTRKSPSIQFSKRDNQQLFNAYYGQFKLMWDKSNGDNSNNTSSP